MYVETNLRQHTAHQTGVRGLVKMQFVTGVAMKLAQTVGIDGFLHVQQKLGELIAATETCRALLRAAEIDHETSASGRSVRPGSCRCRRCGCTCRRAIRGPPRCCRRSARAGC
ncbi:4-hydroxyphenylacetate 3-hydroxylase C-terminal domain-containing protein [Pseudonocardia benzenivorans]